MDVVWLVTAICAGVLVIVMSGRFVRGGETTRTAWTGQLEESGRPRARRAYNRIIVLLCGALFILFGSLDLAGVMSLSGS